MGLIQISVLKINIKIYKNCKFDPTNAYQLEYVWNQLVYVWKYHKQSTTDRSIDELDYVSMYMFIFI